MLGLGTTAPIKACGIILVELGVVVGFLGGGPGMKKKLR